MLICGSTWRRRGVTKRPPKIATSLGFRHQYARAREAQAEVYADDIIAIADDDAQDALADVKGNPVPNLARLNRDRLRIDARKWVISRLLPRYARKLVLEGGEKPVALDLPVREMARRMAFTGATVEFRQGNRLRIRPYRAAFLAHLSPASVT